MLIDPFAPDWLTRLDTLAGNKVSEDNLFLLIDGICVPGLHRKIAAAAETKPTLLFETVSSCNDEARDVSPFLFPYRQHSEALHNALSQCDGWPMVHAILTSESQADLAIRLAVWCTVEADGQRFNFRYPDTRRLPGIFKALTPEQRGHLNGPAKKWFYITRDGSWRALAGLPSPEPKEPRSTKLSDEQFAAMLDDSEPDTVLDMLQRRGREWKRRHSSIHAIVVDALRIADRNSLNDFLARVDWCEACLNDETLLTGDHVRDWLESHA